MKRALTILAAALALAMGASYYISAQTDEPGGRDLAPAAPVKTLAVERGLTQLEKSCIECHSRNTPGQVLDWSRSVMARSNVTCVDCHRAEKTDKDAMDCPGTASLSDVKISPVVTPGDCGRCHPRESKQFLSSKHARTYEIQTAELKDPFLRGMTSEIERAVGCWACHGSDLASGTLTPENWPNVGCGRLNPDGKNGSCAICHTAHRFDIAEARKPENCGQCHLGPDHPQDEIYFESKHGKKYLAGADEWNFEAAPDAWEPATDFTAPTCAACHMSGIGPLSTTHDVGERLKWESQAPLSVLNKDHEAQGARLKMIAACTQCHSPRWARNYLDRYDLAIEHYNEEYYKPAKAIMDDLYEKGILTKWPVFDEEIEWKFYEYWHHEGRRARMGAMMMGPDYAWWHGFYDCKQTYQEIVRLAEEAERNGHGSPIFVPGAGGANLTPADSPPLPEAWKDVKNIKGVPRQTK